MITILTVKEIEDNPHIQIDENGWDFLIEEIDYLLTEHDGQVFVLKDNTLWETVTDDDFKIDCPNENCWEEVMNIEL